MVRTIRRHIANESAWLPGKIGGKNAYAAKASHGETALLEVHSPEATRFSLIGAFLLEFRLRHVVRTAAGRTKLLDDEIPNALRAVLRDASGEEDRERTADPLKTKDLMTVTHAQCLAALDKLEDRYSQELEQAHVEKAKAETGNVRLPDLVQQLEKKARSTPEETALAVYRELMEVRRRLEALEERITRGK